MTGTVPIASWAAAMAFVASTARDLRDDAGGHA